MNISDSPRPQHCFFGGEGLGGSAGGRAVQLSHTLGLLSVLTSEEEHTQHEEGGLDQWSPRQGFTPPHLPEDMLMHIKTCFLPRHDGECPDYTRVPYCLLRIDPPHTSPGLGMPSCMCCEQLQGLHWITARLCTGDMVLH